MLSHEYIFQLPQEKPCPHSKTHLSQQLHSRIQNLCAIKTLSFNTRYMRNQKETKWKVSIQKQIQIVMVNICKSLWYYLIFTLCRGETLLMTVNEVQQTPYKHIWYFFPVWKIKITLLNKMQFKELNRETISS